MEINFQHKKFWGDTHLVHSLHLDISHSSWELNTNPSPNYSLTKFLKLALALHLIIVVDTIIYVLSAIYLHVGNFVYIDSLEAISLCCE